MAEYYLIAQLPSLDVLPEGAPLPVTWERFAALCEQHLGKRAWSDFEAMTLQPPREPDKTGSALLNAWHTGERDLRLALATVRAEKLHKPFDAAGQVVPEALMQVAYTAAEMESPWEAEKYLHEYRLTFLETLRPTDAFSLDYIYYYGLKLKLVSRIRQFHTEAGEAAYQAIYHAIMAKDRLEAVQ